MQLFTLLYLEPLFLNKWLTAGFSFLCTSLQDSYQLPLIISTVKLSPQLIDWLDPILDRCLNVSLGWLRQTSQWFIKHVILLSIIISGCKSSQSLETGSHAGSGLSGLDATLWVGKHACRSAITPVCLMHLDHADALAIVNLTWLSWLHVLTSQWWHQLSLLCKEKLTATSCFYFIFHLQSYPVNEVKTQWNHGKWKCVISPQWNNKPWSHTVNKMKQKYNKIEKLEFVGAAGLTLMS